MKKINYFGLDLKDLMYVELEELTKKPSAEIIKRKISKKHEIIQWIENSKFKISSKVRRKKKNILILGSWRLVEPLAKAINQRIDCRIIRGGEYPGRSIFLPYVDNYLFFKNYSCSKAKINSLKFRKYLTHKNIFPSSVVNRFSELVKYIEIMKSLRSKIDLVITYNDILSFEKTVIKTSNKLGIPTLIILHGFGDNGLKKRNKCFVPFNASKMAVLNELQKNVIAKEGISKEKVEVTGLPALDKYFNETFTKSVRKELKIPEGKKIIIYTAEIPHAERSLFAVSTTKEVLIKRYEEMFNAVKEFPELHLIIKLHPNISLDNSLMSDILEESSKRSNYDGYTVTRDVDAFRILNDSFIVITKRSTMGLESFFLKKPVIVYDTYTKERDLMQYTKDGTALWAKKEGELKERIKQLIDGKGRKKLDYKMESYVDKHYPVKGDASKRLASLIKKMMN